MPARNERNSIIFAGTMGLPRRSAVERLGGWDEWTITEDAETSLRLLPAGWSGWFLDQPLGRGIMPLTFAALKSQRFRWCFGGMQILRKHWRDLRPWDRHPGNRLSVAQRMDYLLGGLHRAGRRPARPRPARLAVGHHPGPAGDHRHGAGRVRLHRRRQPAGRPGLRPARPAGAAVLT